MATIGIRRARTGEANSFPTNRKVFDRTFELTGTAPASVGTWSLTDVDASIMIPEIVSGPGAVSVAVTAAYDEPAVPGSGGEDFDGIDFHPLTTISVNQSDSPHSKRARFVSNEIGATALRFTVQRATAGNGEVRIHIKGFNL